VLPGLPSPPQTLKLFAHQDTHKSEHRDKKRKLYFFLPFFICCEMSNRCLQENLLSPPLFTSPRFCKLMKKRERERNTSKTDKQTEMKDQCKINPLLRSFKSTKQNNFFHNIFLSFVTFQSLNF
jgi:hypothetical protein